MLELAKRAATWHDSSLCPRESWHTLLLLLEGPWLSPQPDTGRLDPPALQKPPLSGLQLSKRSNPSGVPGENWVRVMLGFGVSQGS